MGSDLLVNDLGSGSLLDLCLFSTEEIAGEDDSSDCRCLSAPVTVIPDVVS